MNKLSSLLLLLLPQLTCASDWQTTIIAEAKELYAPVAQASFQKKLEMVVVDEDSAVAGANHDDNRLEVLIYTGLLKAPKLTPDSLRMILCHELGHLFGGAPRRNIPIEWQGPLASDGRSYITSEGQADYYASAVCFKRLLEKSQTPTSEDDMDWSRVGPILEGKCRREAAISGNDLNVCLRSALAALDFLQLNHEFPISCEHSDSKVAPRLIRDFYPSRQCRLDTMINGSVCRDELPLISDFFNQNLNTCSNKEAQRPLCWYPEGSQDLNVHNIGSVQYFL